MSIKQQLTLLFFGMLFISGIAQKEITISEILEKAQYAEQIKLDAYQIDFLKNYNHKLPFVDNLELRSESSNDFLLNKQEYAIRLKTNSIKQILANKKMYQSKINEVEIKEKIHFEEELLERYHVIINYVFNEKLHAAYQERKVQLEDKLAILQHTVYEENFDVKEVVETEEDLFDTNANLLKLQELQNYQIKLLQLMIGAPSSMSINLNTYSLITPAQLIATHIEIDPNANLEIQLKQKELEIISNEMTLDVAKSKKIIDFVQAQYSEENSDFFDENFSVSFGINLPFFGKTRLEKSDHYFDMLDVENEILTLQEDKEKDKKESLEKYKRIVSRYKAFLNQINNSSVSSLLNTYKNIEGVNPLTLVLLKISEHEKEIELLKLEYKLYKEYINLLACGNLLSQTPLKNYLSSNN